MKNKIFTNNKIYSHLDRVSEFLGNRIPFPVVVELDITNKCNNKCPQCIGYNSDGKELSMDKIVKICMELKECGVKAIVLTGGGESLMHKDFFNILNKIKDMDFEIGLITNGTLIKKENACNILKNCEWVRVSVDAYNQEEYIKSHGVPFFPNVINGINALVSEKDFVMNNGDYKDCTIGLGYLIGEDNIENLDKYTKISKELKVDYCQFRPFHFTKAIIKHNDMKYLQDKYNTEKFNVLYSQHKYENLDKPRQYNKCYGHHFTTTICANGKVYLCCHMRNNDNYCLGDLNKDTFWDIWNSKKRQDVYKNINFNDCPPVCRCDTFNTILFNIKESQNQLHKNFL